ncbi:hypothetical protein RDABS01_022225 [Bienertia sinuspersici]
MPFTAQDVKEALFFIPNYKFPGVDGHGSYFFKQSWEVIGDDITKAMLDFFNNGKFLKELGVTSSTLVSKNKYPTSIKELLAMQKKDGGLGFRNIELWNLAAVGKTVWAISQNAENLWVKWVSSVYIKDASWDAYKPSRNASWDVSSQTQICVWLACRGRLQVKERLERMGLVTNNTCLLCGQGVETHMHIMGECTFNRQCIQATKKWLGIGATVVTIPELIRWIGRVYRGTKFRKQVVYASWAAVLYSIWRNRNQIL